MAILRLIFIFVFYWIAFSGVRYLSRYRFKPSSAKPLTLVRCKVCGVYLPRHEAFTHEGHLYCAKHAVAGQSKRMG